ncbi:MAG: pyridoxal phosphate-dependent aminotransferase family protein [Bacteroidetes bacterium]|nr:pyridoxal phosphate-dependent aminotransferase family protein [Bacteroidota bacterium]
MRRFNHFAEQFLSEALERRTEQNALRKLVVNDQLVDFCSNDYLGFARSPELAAAIKKELSDLPTQLSGSTGSRLLAGNTAYAETLEKKIAAFHDAEAGLIYNSGYDANVGLFSALGQKNATIIYDELIHASVHDGIRMSQANSYMFKHNDLFHLEERLKIAEGTCYVAIESIYSMDGDTALLPEIAALCKRYNAALIVDEAHATGVTVNDGKGLVQQLGMETEVFARVHTFGKGLGCHGAIVLGSELLRDYLINFSRAFIYTTALPVHSLVAIQQAYQLLQKSEAKITALQSLITLFKAKAAENPAIQLIESNSPIQCIVIPGNGEVKKIASKLQEEGLDVRPILSPTVQKGKERLRICIHLFNRENDINRLIESVGGHLQTINS